MSKSFQQGWLAVLAFIIIISILTSSNKDYDNTDDMINKEKSGMKLYTDPLTGCQYIQPGVFSNAMHRVDKDGNHVGCK